MESAEEMGMTVILFNRDCEEYEGNVVNDFLELEAMLQTELERRPPDDEKVILLLHILKDREKK